MSLICKPLLIIITIIIITSPKIDATSLNQLAYAAAITVIKIAGVENECIIKKRNINRRKGDWTFNMNRQISDLRADISKISQMNDPRPSAKAKRNTNSMKTNNELPNKIHLTRNTQTTSMCS